MNKKAKISAICGAIFVCAMGTLLHYLYEWSGGNTIAALISGINESTWEHLKLFYIPFLIFTLIEFLIYGKKLENFFTVKLFAALLGMAVTVVSFYTYSGILGQNIAWVNIAIFYISVIAAYIFSYHFLIKEPRAISGKREMLCAVLLVVLCALFFIFTFYPPKIGLFLDPVTNTYGIQRNNKNAVVFATAFLFVVN